MSETSYYLTLGELTQSVRLSTETVITIVECGIVDPRGEQPQQWLFEPQMVTMVQRACRLQRDLELDWPAVALALELIEDLQQLREENQRLRQQLGTLMELDASN
ncbi:MAG: chaperone modulatory protein CbpM [Gammaproteobacteria bacterium]|jgi:chaperone modulatory protein CbpM|nr:chaperone modulatory protein CbpM [Gammaproteobacteria bacterium]